MHDLQFPPLLSGHALENNEDPFPVACQRAVLGCDAGLVVYNLGANVLRAAIVFTPEVALKQATIMQIICAIGFQNALGALAPPEVAVHLGWDGKLFINGARCGQLRMSASSTDFDAIPDWLVIGLELPLWPHSDDPGLTPDQTSLYSEGCADVEAPSLLESYTRHMLNWLARWESEGARPLHNEWRGLAQSMGETVTIDGQEGVFMGVDEDFGMILRDDAQVTHLISLTSRLENL